MDRELTYYENGRTKKISCFKKMNKEITKELKVIVIKNGIEVYLEGERLERFENALQELGGQHKLVRIEGRSINTAELVGIFYPEDLEVVYMRKRGMWQCEKGTWHKRNEECYCNRPLGH